jgi:PEP-CTERM motif
MKLGWIIGCGALAAGFVASVSGANASVVFSDDFNSYGTQLNWVPPANWSVPVGSVELIGEAPTGTQFDFYPGHGGYVDLDGSSDAAGTLQTLGSFAAGSYTLTFDLGGNARGDVDKTTTISLGDFTTSLTLPSSSSYQLYTFNFTTNGGQLSFADGAAGNQDVGHILDNVTLSTAVPEPSTWAMMLVGFVGLGFASYRASRKIATSAT